jgi:tetratricopeptide (TPR) repeat protein
METALIVKSDIPLTLKGNYMDTAEPVKILSKVSSKVDVVSYLTSPYPDGTEQTIDKKELEKKADKLKAKGIDEFKQGKLGKAYKDLSDSISLKKDILSYRYLCFTLSKLKEGDKKFEQKLEKVLTQAIEAFPYEVLFYKMLVLHYFNKEQKEEAKKILKEGLKYNPENIELKNLKDILGQ